MTKPWEEEWELDSDGDIRRLNRKGARTSLVFLKAASGSPESALLASKAPKMARALLDLRELFWHCTDEDTGRCVHCDIDSLLREAGVLE